MDKLRAAVIGSGFGGLAAAIRLQAAGFQTVIFEKRDQPGGRGRWLFDSDPPRERTQSDAVLDANAPGIAGP